MKCDTKATKSQGAKGGKAGSGKGGRNPVNNLRIHDIETLIWQRHGGWCGDPEWMNRYFFAALPHLIVSNLRWLDAVRAWTEEHLPMMMVERGPDWIEEQARACHAKPRKTPRNDRLARLLKVQQNEVIDFGLNTLTAVTRLKKVRDAENRAHRNAAKKAKRALDPNYTPREESKAAKARAAGTTADAIRAKARRDKLKAQAVATDDEVVQRPEIDASDRVSGPTEDALQSATQIGSNTPNDRVSGPTIPLGLRPGFGPNNNTTRIIWAAPSEKALQPLHA